MPHEWKILEYGEGTSRYIETGAKFQKTKIKYEIYKNRARNTKRSYNNNMLINFENNTFS